MDPLTDAMTALSHPLRRDIIRQLALAPARFTDVARPLDVSLNAVTKHLKLLERAGFIARERRGREVMISLLPGPLRLVSGWVHEYEWFWNERLDTFAAHFAGRKGRPAATKGKRRAKAARKKETDR